MCLLQGSKTVWPSVPLARDADIKPTWIIWGASPHHAVHTRRLFSQYRGWLRRWSWKSLDEPDSQWHSTNEAGWEIQESLEDLLIFPTKKGFHRSADMIQSYFHDERALMKERPAVDGRYKSIADGQHEILAMISAVTTLQNTTSRESQGEYPIPKLLKAE